MLLRLRLLTGTALGGAMLLLLLCLGSQNLDQRSGLNLGVGRSVPLPQGFVVGLAVIAGWLSGGLGVALLAPLANRQPPGKA